ncbi:MAG: HPr family phosphocarrier protein [Clostridia bacterium]|nr:HPr family phosphocarrier protein [Clostridia bacterium]
MELTVNAALNGAMMSREAAQIAGRMSEFQSRVLLRHGDMTVNAKSVMGILSLGIRDGMPVTILVSGEDEARAACVLSGLLGA